MMKKRVPISGFLAAILWCCASAGQIGVQYFYDSAGRLTKAVDSTGTVIEYVYDPAGNITQINRSSLASLALLNFTPQQGAAGALIALQGQGFSTTPTSNIVKFGTTAATVISAAATQLVVAVPAGLVPSGQNSAQMTISVQVGSNTATSSTMFTALASTAQNTPPTVTLTSPVANATIYNGQAITLSVSTSGNAVTSVDYSVNGNYLIVGATNGAAYSRNFTIPNGITTITFGARAYDQYGNVGYAAPVTLAPGGSPVTTVIGTTVNNLGSVVPSVTVGVMQNGLQAEYFYSTQQNFSAPLVAMPSLSGHTADSIQQVSALDFLNHAGGVSGALFSNDTFGIGITQNFAARFTGQVTIPTSGRYTFYLGAASGANLLLNGASVAQVLEQNHYAEAVGSVTLPAGKATIEVDYFNDNSQIPELQLSYSGPMVTRQVVPTASLSPTVPLSAETVVSGGTNGTFSISNVPVAMGPISLQASKQNQTGAAGFFQPVPNGTTNAGNVPIGVLIATALSAGGLHNCALVAGSTAYCWGTNQDGNLGNGSSGTSTKPVAVLPPTGSSTALTWASISPGKGTDGQFTCGLTTAGVAYCWGGDDEGRLGTNANPDGSSIPALVAMPSGVAFSQITTGDQHACAATSVGKAYCWGRQSQGQVGNGADQGGAFTPQPVLGSFSFTSLALGTSDSFGLTAAGQAYNWGNNNLGQLGENCGGFCTTPGQVSTTQVFTSLTAGVSHACGLNTLGAAYCWGANGSGQLGVSGGGGSSPQAVSGGLVFAQITAGDNHTCGLTTAGALYCWGANSFGQLGNGGTTSTSTPTLISPPAGSVAITFTSVGAGSAHTCGITALGIIYCWGGNGSGQLGTGNTNGSMTPLVVSSP